MFYKYSVEETGYISGSTYDLEDKEWECNMALLNTYDHTQNYTHVHIWTNTLQLWFRLQVTQNLYVIKIG